MPHFILYSRSYCHLCQDMQDALQMMRTQFAFSIEVIDIDQDAPALAKYDELVPVLLGCRSSNQADQSVQLCHYFLDHEKVTEFLINSNATTNHA